jgi:hypothetical protein
LFATDVQLSELQRVRIEWVLPLATEGARKFRVASGVINVMQVNDQRAGVVTHTRVLRNAHTKGHGNLGSRRFPAEAGDISLYTIASMMACAGLFSNACETPVDCARRSRISVVFLQTMTQNPSTSQASL